MEDKFYPDYTDSDFNRILDKYEFQDQSKRNFTYQDPRQLLMRNLISKNTIYDNILLYWQVGVGKCMKIDTPIIMYDGTIKKIQDIKVNDLLMGDDSTPRRVLNLVRGEDIMYEILPTKGEPYIINSEHVLTLKYNGEPHLINNSVTWFEPTLYKSIKRNFRCKSDAENFLLVKQLEYSTHKNICDIPLQTYLKLPNNIRKNFKCIRTAVEFPEKKLPIDPYIMGYWLGNNTSMKLDSVINPNILYYIINNESTLKEYNLKDIKHIPHIYKCNSRANRLKLLAGILDSNSLVKNGSYELFKSLKYNELIDDIVYLCRSLGYECYKKENNEYCKIYINGNDLDKIPVLCSKKHVDVNKQKNDVLVSNFTVKKLEKDNYYGFTIDKNHRYLLGDFTITHNSCASITIAEGFKEYVSNMGRKILVLVKNGNIEKNFKNELLSECTNNAYITEMQEEYLKSSTDQTIRKELMNKITRKINKVYNFMTYGTFVNQILGMKEFEKDELGKNTTRQKRNPDGSLSRKRPLSPIENLNNTVIIIDEAHNITNNDVYIALSRVLEKSYNYRLVLLTATPMYDNPKEIIELSNLLNMNNPDNILPIRNDLFKTYENGDSIMVKKNSKYLSDGILKSGLTSISETGKDILMHNMKGKVSYLQSNIETFPDKIDMGESLIGKTGSINVVYCYMSKYQNDVYQKALKLDSKEHIDIDAEILDAEDNTEEYLSVSKSSSLYKNSSDAATMTYPNNSYGKEGFLTVFSQTKGSSDYKIAAEYENILSLSGELRQYSAKLAKLLENVNKSPGNIFIYSNYVNYGGTALIKQLLLANGYIQFRGKSRDDTESYKSFILYDDSTNVETREYQRKIFNSEANKDGKHIKIIIGSPVISEGITLKNVRQVHILEPAWNMSRINQIIGRAVRHHSHDALAEDQRNVEIYKYCSVFKTTKPLYFIDKEKYILAEEKDRSNKEVERLLKQVAFDCNINTKSIQGTNGSAECDYTDCKYTCLIKPGNKELDKYTYNMYINFFNEFDIEFIISFIKDMFKNYFIYNTTDIINKIKDIEPMISVESIFTALKQMIDNKNILLDQYNREGFLIEKGDYIVFNPIDIDINSSIYAKTLDFSVNSNEYTLNEYVKSKFDTNIEIPEEIKDKRTKTKSVQEKVELSEEDLKYNKKVSNSKIYGSYRERATKSSGGLYGAYDGKFRIIDRRNITDEQEDKRKNISGMAATSFNKKKLIDIIKYLEITNKEIQKYLGYPSDSIDIKHLGIEQLVDITEKHMNKKHLVLR